MKLLLGTLMAASVSAYPLNSMKVGCVNQGKCVSPEGDFDPTICCSGACDPLNGCLTSTEAGMLIMRATALSSTFVCKPDSFFAVQADVPVYVDSGTVPTECICPANAQCLIGDDDLAITSSRFWIGTCDPTNHACVPQIALTLETEKLLLENGPNGDPSPLPNLGRGSDCSVTDNCSDVSLGCGSVCTAASGLSRLGSLTNVCLASGLSDGAACLCNEECTNGACVVSYPANIAPADVTTAELALDLSLTGTCGGATGLGTDCSAGGSVCTALGLSTCATSCSASSTDRLTGAVTDVCTTGATGLASGETCMCDSECTNDCVVTTAEISASMADTGVCN